MDRICLSTIVYCSNESSKNFFTGNSIQTSAFCPSFIRFPSTSLASLQIQGRAIDNSFQKVNECVTLGGGVAWFPAFRPAFCIFSFLWLFASISRHVLLFQGFTITIIVLLWTSDQLDADNRRTSMLPGGVLHICNINLFEVVRLGNFLAVCGLRRSVRCRTVGTAEPRRLAIGTSFWEIPFYFAYIHLNSPRSISSRSIIF
jgi:hypothetical protein